MWKVLKAIWAWPPPVVAYPSYKDVAAVLGPRYREIDTPFGTIGYMSPAILDAWTALADGGMGAPAEFCDVV